MYKGFFDYDYFVFCCKANRGRFYVKYGVYFVNFGGVL